MRQPALKVEGGDDPGTAPFARPGDWQFRQLLEGLPAAAYTCDAEGLITYFNRSAVQLWGRAPALNDPADRFCGSLRLFSPEGVPIPHDQCWMARALQTGTGNQGEEIVIERPDGRRITTLAHANPLFDESGRLVGAVNVLVDISDRKRADDAQTLLAAIVESSDDAIVSKTLEGRILSWNAGAERLFGHTAAEAIGQPITLIIPPERHDEERSILARLGQGQRVDHYETERVAKDGRRIAVSLTSSPVRDSTGKVVGASKVARDITPRKQSEQALAAVRDELEVQFADLQRLHEMSERLSTMLELQPILEETLRTAAAIATTDLAVLSLREQEAGDVRVAAHLGFDEESLAALQSIPTRAGAFGLCLQGVRRVAVEDAAADPGLASYLPAVRMAGFQVLHCTPLITGSGNTIGALTVYFRQTRRPSPREIALVELCAQQATAFIENARLYAKLREEDRTKNEFLATLAHELRNPLAPIRNAVHVLQLVLHLNDATTDESRWALQVIERQMQQLSRLVDDLLDLARITSNKLELRNDRITLGEIVQAAVEASTPLIDGYQHELVICEPPQPLYVHGDLTRLAQVVSNLLNNAAKYTERGGLIRLSVERQAGQVAIAVRDNGSGIPDDMLPRIFDMFTQANRALDPAQSGLGIGLTLVKRLVEMHGGTVEGKSEGPNQGSEFVVRLPLAAEPAPPPALVQQPAAPVVPPSALRILVLDDNPDSADSLAALLAIPGNQVRVAYDGLDGVALAAEFRPDAALLDLRLPRLDGYQVAQRIREQPWGREMVLIALTGWGQEEAKQLSKEVGFDQHLVKPVDPAALLLMLADLHQARAVVT